MDQKKYMDIQVLKPAISDGFRPGDHIVVQEKIDGANFSIRYDESDGTIKAFSRRKALTPLDTLRGAWNWAQNLDPEKIESVLGGDQILFMEWLVSHTVKYPEDCYKKAYCYDIYDTATKKYLPQDIVKRKKNRYITINNAVIEAVTLYLMNTENVSLSDYLFKSEAVNSGDANIPLTVRSIDRILKGIAKDMGLSTKVSTHTLRKTFCYWMMVYGQNDSRRLLLLQKMLNHSSPAQTLDYIGLTQEEISNAYQTLNLGASSSMCLVDSVIGESDVG